MMTDLDTQIKFLKDKTKIILRPLRKSDKAKLLDGFNALSELSRYRRFLHNKNELKQYEIDCLFNLPEELGVSFIALEYKSSLPGKEGRCIGLIQIIELDSPPDTAEVALAVIDEFHNCGLGKLLLKRVESEAAERNIKALHFYTTADNAPLAAILKRTGWDLEVKRDHGSVTYISNMQDNAPEFLPDCAIANDVIKLYHDSIIDRCQLWAKTWFKQLYWLIKVSDQFQQKRHKSRTG